MHELLLSATDLKVASLTGAPIINYPNEIGVLYNILRGHIKTWEFLITVKSSEKINKETIMAMFERANFRTYDFVEYGGNKLKITRNPFGFVNTKDAANKARTLV